MIIDNVRVMNFENAFRGLRNPMNSWAKSDSVFGFENEDYISQDIGVAEAYMDKYYPELSREKQEYEALYDRYLDWLGYNGIVYKDFDLCEYAFIGPNDLDLAQRMIAGQEPNDKFLRQIFVSMDITAPLYWWKEFDTYKVATTANSTSTMHKIHSMPITLDSYETDDYNPNLVLWKGAEGYQEDFTVGDMSAQMIQYFERLRQLYNENKEKNPDLAKKYWKELIRWNSDGWVQTRTWTGDYITLRHMYFWRHNHKLTEWHKFCEEICKLPYAMELITYQKASLAGPIYRIEVDKK